MGPVWPDDVQETGVSLDGQSGSPFVAAEAQQVEQLEEDLVTGPDPRFLCPSRKSRYSAKSSRSGVSAHSSPGPIPSWRLFQMWDPVRYTAFRSSEATVK